MIVALKKYGWVLVREGANHEVCSNGKGKKTMVGRRTEMPEPRANAIIKLAEQNPG